MGKLDHVYTAADDSTVRFVTQILKTRRRRDAVFGSDLFGEPAWDMLLELYRAELEQRRISVRGVASAAGVPQTTAGRALEKLHGHGFIRREIDRFDARRTWVTLTKKGSSALHQVLGMSGLRPI